MRQPQTAFVSARQADRLCALLKVEAEHLEAALDAVGIGIDIWPALPGREISVAATSAAADANGIYLAVSFDRESAEYCGFSNLDIEQQDALAMRAAELMGGDDLSDCISRAFDLAAQHLGFLSDDDIDEMQYTAELERDTVA